MPHILIAARKDLLSPECLLGLGAKGYQLVVCGNLTEAVGMIFDDPPDILLVEKGFCGNGDLEVIKAVHACLQKTNIPILLVLPETMQSGMDWNVYAVDDFIVQPFAPGLLLARLQLAESRMVRVFDNNPLSRLPGNTSILKAIQQALDSHAGTGVCYVDIDNFKPYNDRYGFARGDEVLLMVARILVNVVEEMAREGSFVGHVGGDDFVFLIREELAASVCERILANFEAVRNMFLSREDLSEGAFVGRDRQGRETRFGLLSLSIAVVTTGRNKFRHAGEVSAAASQVKHYVKKLEGSNYKIDQRGGYTATSFL